MPVELAGISLVPGTYYLGVRRPSTGDGWLLAIHEAAEIRRAKIDAYETTIRPMPEAMLGELSSEVVEGGRDSLTILLDADDGEPTAASMTISFGPYRLRAPIELESVPSLGEWPEPTEALPTGSHPLTGVWKGRARGKNFHMTLALGGTEDEANGMVFLQERTIFGLAATNMSSEGEDLTFDIPLGITGNNLFRCRATPADDGSLRVRVQLGGGAGTTDFDLHKQ